MLLPGLSPASELTEAKSGDRENPHCRGLLIYWEALFFLSIRIGVEAEAPFRVKALKAESSIPRDRASERGAWMRDKEGSRTVAISFEGLLAGFEELLPAFEELAPAFEGLLSVERLLPFEGRLPALP